MGKFDSENEEIRHPENIPVTPFPLRFNTGVGNRHLDNTLPTPLTGKEEL